VPRNSTTDSERNPRTVTLVAFGIAYAALTLLWMWATTSNQLIFDSKFDESMSKFGEFFAIVAAPLWFFATLNQIESFRWRVTVLALGIVLLVPVPLVAGVSPL
jgi:hypothetical protein